MDDKYILELYRSGERTQAFNHIVRTYGERLYLHIRSMVQNHEDTDDVLQNTMLKAWKGLDSFRADSGLYTWLYRIATNETLTFLGSRKTSFLSFTDEEKELENRLANDPTFHGDKVEIELQKAISQLPARQKAVFCMRYYDEKKYEEMADILGITVGALKATYHHAYNKVLDHLKKTIEFEN